jgi:hypothetical protein
LFGIDIFADTGSRFNRVDCRLEGIEAEIPLRKTRGNSCQGRRLTYGTYYFAYLAGGAAPPKGKADHSENPRISHLEVFGPKRQVQCG